MDSIIELQRQTHEEVERLEKALAIILSQPTSQHDVRLANEHRAKHVLERVAERMSTLSSSYADVDSARRREQELVSKPSDPAEELSEFYIRLNRIKEFHSKYPDTPADPFVIEVEAIFRADEMDEDEEDPIGLLFSGEESYGRYLDLYTNHTQYVNIKHIGKRVSYIQYLDLLAASKGGSLHNDLPANIRGQKDYELYLFSLHSYLLSFTKRTKPLLDVDREQADAEEEFEKLWQQGQITGWGDDTSGPEGQGEGVRCSACQKMYSKQTVYDAHLKSKKHIKAVERAESNASRDKATNGKNPDTPDRSSSRFYPAARLTALIQPLLEGLANVIVDTKANVERRFSLTARERELEQEAPTKKPVPVTNTTTDNANEEEEEEEKIYNPLKLPLGWDGKPIPYWLYKLHGLGVEYRCEICSDAVYMGRKNFERHFQESRHAFGMRALGLPNTKHFHEITRIEDALALAEKLKQEGRQEIFQQETMEELEDDDGNVYNRKTYEDLKKQGII
ncbi:uncharacterized protein EI90DRAFT_3033292 [Cantharellus anzutake]|uniref:uncharacterized protein n=1 Tax=Cantharellus anzutake TaxID=1750568 RepID=UPI0019030615|nr:uncharacterized protein EI90DRAFT_3033292 [Cantharellus anzutake]KAF8341265.1 hypothetical protein EI90DRAFT_3033292 [Cantharellus anzutake]